MRVPARTAATFAGRVLERLGAPSDIAALVARSLVDADLSGHASHGLAKLGDYAQRIEQGSLVPDGRAQVVSADARAYVLVDGGHGFGHPAARMLTMLIADRAKAHGFAVGGIVNASHTGRLGEWAELAVEQGVVFFLCSAATEAESVVPYGGASGALGTNPFTFGVPAADGDSFVLDCASSAIAGARVKQLAALGELLPPDVALDAAGEPTRDPQRVRDGGALLAFGGHKGYGLSLLVSLLGGCFVGAAADDARKHGVFAFAADVGLFADPDTVLAHTRAQLERMRHTPPRAGGEDVQAPGDYERRSRICNDGAIVLPAAVAAQLGRLGSDLGIVSQPFIVSERV